jgi:protein tyrosine/serine phosphatase
MLSLLTLLAAPLLAAGPAPKAVVVDWNSGKDPVAQTSSEIQSPVPLTPPNFRLVSRTEQIYRSARPGRRGLKALQGLGVKTILNLEEFIESGLEGFEARGLGIADVNVPMSGFGPPSFEQLDRALAVMTDPNLAHPLLVHCRLGEDRTGIVVAAYRVVVEGASAAQAAREAVSIGCCHFLMPQAQVEQFLNSYKAHRLGGAY